MNSPNDIIRKRLEGILAKAEDLDGDSIIIKVDSPPLVDGFQPIGETNVDEKAVAIIGNYLQSQEGCITSRGISWKVSSYDQDRIEINRIRPKPTPKKPDDADASNINEISNKIISAGLEGGAKEILIQPSGNQIDVLFRVGGMWINFDYDLNPRLWNALLTRIRILAQMDISETSVSQKGLILVNTDQGVDYKIDVSIRPAAEGSAITMRIKKHSYEKYIAAALSEDTTEGGTRSVPWYKMQVSTRDIWDFSWVGPSLLRAAFIYGSLAVFGLLILPNFVPDPQGKNLSQPPVNSVTTSNSAGETNQNLSRPIFFGAALSILILLGLPIYFLPTIVAYRKKKRQVIAIAVLNLLLGWTFLCWVVALVWACMED